MNAQLKALYIVHVLILTCYTQIKTQLHQDLQQWAVSQELSS